MNNLFDPHRFALLCRKEWMEEWRKKLKMYAFLPMLILVLVMWWSYNMMCQYEVTHSYYERAFSDRAASNLIVNACWVFFGYAIYVLSTMLSSRISNRRDRVVWLLTPASSLEKYLVSVLKVFVCLFVLFPLFVWCEEVLRVMIFSTLYPKLDVGFITYSQIIGDGSRAHWTFFYDWESVRTAVWVSLSCLSPLTLGAVLWPKYSIVRTVFAAFLLTMLALILFTTLQAVLFSSPIELENALNQLSFRMHWLADLGDEKYIRTFFLCGFIPFCWIMSYLRFKELELIDRW